MREVSRMFLLSFIHSQASIKCQHNHIPKYHKWYKWRTFWGVKNSRVYVKTVRGTRVASESLPSQIPPTFHERKRADCLRSALTRRT